MRRPAFEHSPLVAKRKKLPYGTRFNYIVRKCKEGVGHKQLMSQRLFNGRLSADAGRILYTFCKNNFY
jgi:hypothetical protein